jgi:hypothetical protein
MSLWEYKVISSGKGGFATPALLEKFLNDLGRDEWEVIEFRAAPDNPLAFSGLARRSTQRDWTLEDAAAAAAKAEAEKLRAEFEAKFKAATSTAPTAEERTPSFLEEKVAPDDGLRSLVDTSHDADPEAPEEEKDEWDKLTAAENDELPTFFEAIKPHMRRNQRGPGMSVGVDYLAKKWDQSEEDLKGALVECGFVIPDDEDAKVDYLEYDGDLFWLNINRRGELWINTKEKPRPVFKAVKAQKVTIEEEPKPETQRADDRSRRADNRERRTEDSGASTEQSAAGAAPSEQGAPREARPEAPSAAPLPEGAALLQKIRPHMRRNRRGPGGSGSTSFLARALRTKEDDLKAAFATLGLAMPAHPNDKPVYTELGDELWWLNLDSRGGLWINGREKKPGETAADAAVADQAALDPAATTAVPDAAATALPVEPTAAASDVRAENIPAEPIPNGVTQPAPASVLAGIRLLLKETKTGAVAGKVDRLAEELGKSPDALVAMLVGAGLKVPEKAREKPVFVEHAGEILWFNKNAKGELWLNAKASKFADRDDESEGDESDGETTSETGGGEASAENGAEGGDKKPRSRLSRGGGRRPKKVE